MPDAALTPESIVAEIETDLVAAINQGVDSWWKRRAVIAFAPKVAAWVIGFIILRTAPWAYPILMALEPIAVKMFLPIIARWFTMLRTLYSSRITFVAGVNLATISGRPVTFAPIFNPGVDIERIHASIAPPLRIYNGDPERN